MAYTVSRVRWGKEGPQWALRYDSPTVGALPAIVYVPGGGWKGADPVAWEGEFLYTGGLSVAGSWQESCHVFVLNAHSVGYNSTQATGLTAWAATTVYALDAFVSHLGRKWRAIQGHTATAGVGGNEPQTATAWADFWSEVGPNHPKWPQVAGVGESTPGFGDQSAADVQQFIGWLRHNAATYDVDPERIILGGASAGGQRSGVAAYAMEQPYSRSGEMHGAYDDAVHRESRPNLVYMSITPTNYRAYTSAGLYTGLYGTDFVSPSWANTPTVVKDALDPLYVLKRSGMAVPTYLSYLGSYYNDANAASVYSSSLYHHALNGWNMMQQLTAPRPTGFGRTDCRYMETDAQSLVGIAAWVTGAGPTNYVVGNEVVHGGVRYYCIQNHTSTGSGDTEEPGVGGSWTSYWEVSTGFRATNQWSATPTLTRVGHTAAQFAHNFFTWADDLIGI